MNSCAMILSWRIILYYHTVRTLNKKSQIISLRQWYVTKYKSTSCGVRKLRESTSCGPCELRVQLRINLPFLASTEATPPTNQQATTGSQLQSHAVPTAPVTTLDNSGLYWSCTCLSDINYKRTFVQKILCSRWWRQCWSPIVVYL